MKPFSAGEFVERSASPSGAGPAEAYAQRGKRVLDVTLALALAPVCAFCILLLAALVWLSDGGAPFFGHKRVGRGGRGFACWKLRTMVPDADVRLAEHLAACPAAAAEWRETRKLTSDPRITRFGDLLRRTSLDELPQIWNVLRGDMSFVGPRPVPEDELALYGAARSVYCAMRPGITGLWQIGGRNAVSYETRVALDVSYLHRLSLRLDLSILARTLLVIVRPNGR